ncbi:4'-phosphopantetheinyl transferase family protein [Brevibacterium otitidis]|uniref:4'-phosphopantetheinyl transferase family protein n=1 Tax=Brevibacterium otitidis TaxID=53364 RepID=A0ABV5X0J0_9MICO|nr:hypothetical protein GCM10023233_16620 [Brevibacterium otitidis]
MTALPGVMPLPAADTGRADLWVWIVDLQAWEGTARERISRLVLACHLQVKPEAVQLSADGRGAPVLHIADEPGPCVSFARSGGLLAIATADTLLGVDIEVRASAQTAADVTTLLHPHEQDVISGADPQLHAAVFTQIWTRKEALLKAYGTGLRRELAADDVTTASAAGTGLHICDLKVPEEVAAAAGQPVHAAVCLAG